MQLTSINPSSSYYIHMSMMRSTGLSYKITPAREVYLRQNKLFHDAALSKFYFSELTGLTRFTGKRSWLRMDHLRLGTRPWDPTGYWDLGIWARGTSWKSQGWQELRSRRGSRHSGNGPRREAGCIYNYICFIPILNKLSGPGNSYFTICPQALHWNNIYLILTVRNICFI